MWHAGPIYERRRRQLYPLAINPSATCLSLVVNSLGHYANERVQLQQTRSLVSLLQFAFNAPAAVNTHTQTVRRAAYIYGDLLCIMCEILEMERVHIFRPCSARGARGRRPSDSVLAFIWNNNCISPPPSPEEWTFIFVLCRADRVLFAIIMHFTCVRVQSHLFYYVCMIIALVHVKEREKCSWWRFKAHTYACLLLLASRDF